MPVRLIVCTNCTYSRPEIRITIEQLQSAHRDHLAVYLVECLAACDAGPSAMLEHDYLPRVTADDLRERIEQSLAVAKVA